jgi:hypothetical protein
MPLNISAFSMAAQFARPRLDFTALLQRESDPSFDWGFDLELPYEHLCVFARHLDTAAPITRLPVFAIADFALTPTAQHRLRDADLEASPVFPRLPLGVIGTDHVGYGSFDLWPVRQVQVIQAIKEALIDAKLIGQGKPRLAVQLSRLLVLPFKDPALAFDAIIEGDLGANRICLRMDIDFAMLNGRAEWPPMPAMQSPGIIDWRLSPGSFSMAGALLIGEDGCETLLPSNLASRLIRFQQIVRTPGRGKATFPVIDPAGALIPAAELFSGDIVLGYAVQYHTEWFPLGHSLGQIAYSLPLAPGEKMKIAIIDWTRRDAAKRTEQTTEKEDLQHAALRERSLSEAVSMVVRESQSGSSFMAGGALSAGAGIPIGAVSLGIGAAFGAGGASANSQGMRSLIGNSTQQISDAFHQATSAQRELNSTVVIQSEQAETADARTRVVANYNHSHALTILYYEVLQHQRLVTRPASIHPVLFLKHKSNPFTNEIIERYRQPIAGALLDESVRGCLDVVAKRACLELNIERAKKKREAEGDAREDFELGEFSFRVRSGPTGPIQNIYIGVIPKGGGTAIPCEFTDPSIVASPLSTVMENFMSRRVKPNEEFLTNCKPTQKIRWANVESLELGQTIAPATHTETHNAPPPADWVISELRFVTNQGADKWVMFSGVPADNSIPSQGFIRVGVQPFIPPIKSVDDLLSEEELCCLRRLTNHLNEHRAYYWRAIWLAEAAADRALRLERWQIDGKPLLDIVTNKLIDFVDGYAVMPVASGAERELARVFEAEDVASLPVFTEYIEQIVTVPARGVFAEAKLGHCNSSEVIDPTRFWDWQTSPIPDEAPAIGTTSTESRAQDPTKGLAPTPFPQPIVNIVNPQSLPDPTGMMAAASVMSALGAFRDMSGLKELGPFLQTLSNNATQLASQGMKGAQTADLISQIRASKEIPDDKKAALISELLTGQVKGNAPTPSPTPTTGTTTPGTTPAPTTPGATPPMPGTPVPPPKPAPVPSRPATVSPKSRLLVFNFKYDTGQQMVGEYQVTVRDNKSGNEYIQDQRFDGIQTAIVEVSVPGSVVSAILTVRGTVGRTAAAITTPPSLRAEDWHFSVNTAGKLVSDLTKVSGVDVVGKTKEVAFEVTRTVENGKETSVTNSNAVTITGGGGVDVKAVTVKLEGASEIKEENSTTTTQGNTETTKTSYKALVHDIQKEPSIEPIL